MTNSKSSLYRVPQEHLTTSQLYQYLEGELSATDHTSVEQHLLDCNMCAEALEGFSLVSPHQAEAALLEINHQIKNRSARRKENPILAHLKNWGITTAILFILIFAAVAVWYFAKQTPKKPTPPTQILKLSAASVSRSEAYQPFLQNKLS